MFHHFIVQSFSEVIIRVLSTFVNYAFFAFNKYLLHAIKEEWIHVGQIQGICRRCNETYDIAQKVISIVTVRLQTFQ